MILFLKEQGNWEDEIYNNEGEKTYFDDSDWYKGFYEKEYNKNQGSAMRLFCHLPKDW